MHSLPGERLACCCSESVLESTTGFQCGERYVLVYGMSVTYAVNPFLLLSPLKEFVADNASVCLFLFPSRTCCLVNVFVMVKIFRITMEFADQINDVY